MKIRHILPFLLIFSIIKLEAQHDSLFYNFQFGLKIGGTYNFTNKTENAVVFEDGVETTHTIGIPENGYGFAIGAVGLFKLSDMLSLQTEIDVVKITSLFDYDVQLAQNELGILETSVGIYDQKELYFQIPVLLKLIVGKDWKFAFGAGAFFRGSAFSSSKWNYNKTEFGRFINGEWAAETPAIVKNDLDDQIQLFEGVNFGAVMDLGVLRPITKTHSLFIEFRYSYPFKREHDAPAFSQQNLTASVGVMMKILKMKGKEEQEEKKRKRKTGGGFDF